MEPLWIFSATDQSIDIVGGLIYAYAFYRSLYRLVRNNITTQGKILLGFICLISTLHIFQVLIQVIYGGPLGTMTFRIWDIVNFVTAFLFVMVTDRIELKEKK